MHLEGIEPTTTRLRKPVLYPLSYQCMRKRYLLFYTIIVYFASVNINVFHFAGVVGTDAAIFITDV